jgi:hypothetical protein
MQYAVSVVPDQRVHPREVTERLPEGQAATLQNAFEDARATTDEGFGNEPVIAASVGVYLRAFPVSKDERSSLSTRSL